MTPEQYDEKIGHVAPEVLSYVKTLMAHRLDTVVLLARAWRELLDELAPEDRGPHHVIRDWNLPELSERARSSMAIVRDLCNHISLVAGRVFLFSRMTQMALDELPPEERSRMIGEIARILCGPTSASPGGAMVTQRLTIQEVRRSFELPDERLAELPLVRAHREPQPSPQEYECGCVTVIRVTDRDHRLGELPFEMRLAVACGGDACEVAANTLRDARASIQEGDSAP